MMGFRHISQPNVESEANEGLLEVALLALLLFAAPSVVKVSAGSWVPRVELWHRGRFCHVGFERLRVSTIIRARTHRTYRFHISGGFCLGARTRAPSGVSCRITRGAAVSAPRPAPIYYSPAAIFIADTRNRGRTLYIYREWRAVKRWRCRCQSRESTAGSGPARPDAATHLPEMNIAANHISSRNWLKSKATCRKHENLLE